MNRKKIILVITKSNWGGAQKYVYDLATNLPKDSFESVVVFGGTGPLADKLSSAGIRTISIPGLGRDVNPLADLATLFKLVSLFKKERPDAVHVNSSKVGGLGALAARISKVPKIIFTCHGWAFNEDRDPLSISLIRFFSWLTVMLSHRTIAVSERDLKDGSRLLFAKHKITLIHNGITPPEFMEKAEARKKLVELAGAKSVNVDENDFLIGAIGELHRNKAYEYALEAISILKQKNIPAKLMILGEGEARKDLESQIRELKLEKDVVLAGFLKDAPRHLKAFDSFVLSSIKEGLPYVVIEAGFAGLPVVATNVGGVREIIEDMKSGILVQTRKPEEIASGLEVIYKDKEKALLFGQNLQTTVAQEFSIEKMVKETLAVY